MAEFRVIINADDCGYSHEVDEHIRKAIETHCISSTTVMAGMKDFDGAIRLYDEFKDSVSFGFHFNLTEGRPFLYSQALLDLGFYKEENGEIIYNAQPFRRKLLTGRVREEIYREMIAQVTCLMDAGIRISHVDGHHFIHQAVFMLPLLPRFCKEKGVFKVRNYRNYMSNSWNCWIRNQWIRVIKLGYPKIYSTDWFTGFEDFYKLEAVSKKYFRKDDTVELMCHPGGKYRDEEGLLMNTNVEELFNCKLINYNQL